MQHSKISKLILKFYDEQSINILNKVEISITGFSFALGSNVAHTALPGISEKASQGSPIS